jgi:hypothetical protein
MSNQTCYIHDKYNVPTSKIDVKHSERKRMIQKEVQCDVLKHWVLFAKRIIDFKSDMKHIKE